VELIRRFTVAVLVVTIFGIPAMACLTPSQPMTMAEHECCRRMAHDCGSMPGSETHSCCQIGARPRSPFVGVSHFAVERHAVVLRATPSEPAMVPVAPAESKVNAISHSPPPLESMVLRI